jgi:hypothetical protein
MDQISELPPPTSSADTRETEPEVVAGISSGEGNPDMPLSIRAEAGGFGWRAILLLAGGVGLGYAVSRLVKRG